MLVNLGIWNEIGNGWQLDTTFRNNLTGAIFGGSVVVRRNPNFNSRSSWIFSIKFQWIDVGFVLLRPTNWFDESDSTAPSDRTPKSLKELNNYSAERWDVSRFKFEFQLQIRCFSVWSTIFSQSWSRQNHKSNDRCFCSRKTDEKVI